MKKTKWLKTAEISLITLLCITCLSLPILAVYTSGDYDTPRYYSPMHFDFEIFGTTAQLTPTISYNYGHSLTYDTTETATQGVGEGSVINSISRTNFSVSTLTDRCLDVSYRLQFNLNESVNNFSMRIVNNGGIYDFVKYGIPQLSVPTGYTANVETMYSLRFTQEQPTEVNVANVTMSGTYVGGTSIPLLRDFYNISGESYTIVGGVFVEDYITEITFTKDYEDTLEFGEYGWYLFDSVLIAPEFNNIFEIAGLTHDYLYFDWMFKGENYSNFIIHFSVEGVVYSTKVDCFGFLGSGSTVEDFIYMTDEWDTDFGMSVYSFDNESWDEIWIKGSGTTVPEEYWDEDGLVCIPAEDLRLISFQPVGSTPMPRFDNKSYWRVSLANTSLGSNTDEVKDLLREEFLSFFEGNTVLYAENPLTMTETIEGSNLYSFTDGDGGMYFHYYVDPNLNLEYKQTTKDLYDYGVSVGYGNGGEHSPQFTSNWIGNAVKGIMDAKIFPGFSIGHILGAIVSLGVVVALLKFFAGG